MSGFACQCWFEYTLILFAGCFISLLPMQAHFTSKMLGPPELVVAVLCCWFRLTNEFSLISFVPCRQPQEVALQSVVSSLHSEFFRYIPTQLLHAYYCSLSIVIAFKSWSKALAKVSWAIKNLMCWLQCKPLQSSSTWNMFITLMDVWAR